MTRFLTTVKVCGKLSRVRVKIKERQRTQGGAWSLYFITIVTILWQVAVNIPTTPITIQITWETMKA